MKPGTLERSGSTNHDNDSDEAPTGCDPGYILRGHGEKAVGMTDEEAKCTTDERHPKVCIST